MCNTCSPGSLITSILSFCTTISSIATSGNMPTPAQEVLLMVFIWQWSPKQTILLWNVWVLPFYSGPQLDVYRMSNRLLAWDKLEGILSRIYCIGYFLELVTPLLAKYVISLSCWFNNLRTDIPIPLSLSINQIFSILINTLFVCFLWLYLVSLILFLILYFNISVFWLFF